MTLLSDRPRVHGQLPGFTSCPERGNLWKVASDHVVEALGHMAALAPPGSAETK